MEGGEVGDGGSPATEGNRLIDPALAYCGILLLD
jgi:hypothetical protein